MSSHWNGHSRLTVLIERQRHRWRARSTLAFMLIAPGPGKRQRDCNRRDSIAWTSTDLRILEQS